MAWRSHTDPGTDGTVHVWPEDDLIVHETELPGWTECICGTTVERQPNGNVLVTHHSLDGRELSEP